MSTLSASLPTPWRRGSSPSSAAGMTMIELLVVLFIVAGLLVGGVLLFNQMTRAALKQQSLRVAGVVKYTYGQAAIQQRYHRLVIDLDSGDYWVESAGEESPGGPPAIPEPSLIGGPEEAQAPKAARRRGYDSDDAEGSVFGLSRPSYQPKEDMILKRKKLEGNIKFFSVLTPQSERPITSGKATITFFPNGFVERSQIILTDGDEGYMTMEIAPLTGKVFIESGKQDVPRDFFDTESDD